MLPIRIANMGVCMRHGPTLPVSVSSIFSMFFQHLIYLKHATTLFWAVFKCALSRLRHACCVVITVESHGLDVCWSRCSERMVGSTVQQSELVTAPSKQTMYAGCCRCLLIMLAKLRQFIGIADICWDITGRQSLLLPMLYGWLATFKLGIGLLLHNF